MEKFFTRTMSKFRTFRSQKLDPIGKLFTQLHITPNILTSLSLLSGLLCVYYLFSHYLLFVLFGFLHLFFDAMDGVVARLTKSSSFGQYFDISVDSLISILFLVKVSSYLTDIYPLLIAGLFTLTVLIHLISKLKAPVVFIRSAAFGVLLVALIPAFWFETQLLILGYLAAGIMAAYSLAKQVQWKMEGKDI